LRISKRSIAAAALLSVFFVATAGADLAPEKVGMVTLPAEPSPHWVWFNDVAFTNMVSGRTYLVDADAGRVLGMLSTGVMFAKLDLPKDYSEIYSPETYYSRGARGERTDVVTIYDPQTLDVKEEIIIPAKRHSGVPVPAYSSLTDDDRFLIIYNMTPAQSVSVVDVKERKFIEEISTPGCALVYGAGDRRFNMLCGDGSVLTVTIDDGGSLVSKELSEAFFDPQADPVTEKAVRYGDTWIYVSFAGVVHPVDVSGDKPSFLPAWSLLSDTDKAESWLPGGLQHLVVHQKKGLLYSAMHKGGVDSHKDPGSEVWVYDLATQKRIKRFAMKSPAGSLAVTQDDNSVLLTVFGDESALQVYDAETGEHLRTVADIAYGATPTILHVP